MSDYNVFPATGEFGIDAETPTGFPVDITPTTAEFGIDAGITPSSGGPVVYADDHLFPPEGLPPLGNYVIEVRDIIGGFYTTLTDEFTCTEIGWELNGMGDMQMTGPITDPNLAALFDPLGNVIDGREIQVRRDDLSDPFHHFVPSPRMNPRTLNVQGYDPTFHLSRKYVGRNDAPPPDLVVNGNFDIGLTGWTPSGSITATWSPSPVQLAPGAVVLDASTAGANYIFQTIDIDALPFASFLFVSGYIWLDEAVDVRNLATNGRGLWTVFRTPDLATVTWQQGVSPNWRQKEVWQKVFTKIFVDANTAASMDLRLYGPLGIVRWDNVVIHRSERLNCEGDPGTIIACLVAHAQDPGFLKSNVNVGVDNSRGSGGVTIARRYKFEEAANIYTAMGEMASLRGGVDFLCETETVNTRTVFTMSRLGWDPGANRVTLDWGGNLNGFDVTWNPQKRADIVRVQGRGSGDEVVEAIVNDEDSDLGWEAVTYATIEGTANPQFEAEGRAQVYKRPMTIELQVRRTATFDVGWNLLSANGGGLLPGRLVDVNIEQGIVSVHEAFKIIRTQFVPEKEVATLQAVAVSTLLEE